jgi:hypothetical protein
MCKARVALRCPTTVDEAKQVLIVDFDRVTEKNGIMLFRRPKRFSKVFV